MQSWHNVNFFFLLFFLSLFVGHIHMSYFGATGTPVLDFWWCLFWVSKPEWVLPYSHCGGECNVHSLRSTSGATRCRPLDGQHCGALTGFISCPRILTSWLITLYNVRFWSWNSFWQSSRYCCRYFSCLWFGVIISTKIIMILTFYSESQVSPWIHIRLV